MARSAEPPRMMFAVMTIFGAVRFGAVCLAETVRSRIALAVFAASVVWCSLLPSYAPEIFEVSAKCLVLVAACYVGRLCEWTPGWSSPQS